MENFFKKHSEVKKVACVFPDVNGYPRGKIMPAADFQTGRECRISRPILMQTITGGYPADAICDERDCDVRLLADIATLRILPWRPSEAWCIHDALNDQGEREEVAARQILQSVVHRLKNQGLTSVVAAEIEFYLFARDGQEANGFAQPAWRGGGGEIGQSGFCVAAGRELEAFWLELEMTLEQLAIPLDTWQHELGPSQYEVNLRHGDALAMADAVMLFKFTLREVAARHGLLAVFMAKPLAGEYGSSMHLHASLLDETGKNSFVNANGENAPQLLSAIAGLQTCLPEMMLCLAPHINSWRRFVAGMCAPVGINWGWDNRTVALRIPDSPPVARRIENRLPGSDANPYLALAATLAAMLYGIEQQLTPTPAVSGSGYQQQDTGENRLPTGMGEAIWRLSASSVAKQCVGAKAVEMLADVKRCEYADYMAEITPWERRWLARQT